MKDTVRKRRLPEGWYPDTENAVNTSIEKWEEKKQGQKGKSVIVPHAGWYFSGKIAANTIKLLSEESDIIVIAGGHLGSNDSVLIADEAYFETPLGEIKNSVQLLEKLLDSEIVKPDRVPDNTVEIQLPFVKKYFPETEIIWIRIPPEYEKVRKISSILTEYKNRSGKKITVAGSTDLTHYGINYGFMNHGTGEKALSWVKNVNDRNYIDMLLQYRIEESIEYALTERSACSAGGAALAAVFAEEEGCTESELLYYYTSNDIYPSDSFVGYAGIIYF